MREIIILTDFYGRFQTKVPSNPYAAGFNLVLLQNTFAKLGFKILYKSFSDLVFEESYKERIILYTSIEDPGGYYRHYIEDILLGLKEAGAILIPDFKYFKAHENKVFMEILRKILLPVSANNIHSSLICGIPKLKQLHQLSLEYPVVIKSATGSASRGVALAKDESTLKRILGKYCNTYNFYAELIDFLLHKKLLLSGIKYYNRSTPYRKKVIIQQYINDLKYDFKILIYGEKYYVLQRLIRKNDFRASGSHNFVLNNDILIPAGLLDICKEWFEYLNVPNISMDVAEKDGTFYLLEFQFISFGTYTQTSAEFYYKQNNDQWQKIYGKIDLEEVYAVSIKEYIEKNDL